MMTNVTDLTPKSLKKSEITFPRSSVIFIEMSETESEKVLRCGQCNKPFNRGEHVLEIQDTVLLEMNIYAQTDIVNQRPR